MGTTVSLKRSDGKIVQGYQFKSIPIANLFKGLAIPELAVGTGQLERGQALVYLNRCRVSRIMCWPSV
jgi:hypothetical protein